ncbi:MAG: hypothetical protein ABFD89_03630 [Bryobacteraceae bacterium]
MMNDVAILEDRIASLERDLSALRQLVAQMNGPMSRVFYSAVSAGSFTENLYIDDAFATFTRTGTLVEPDGKIPVLEVRGPNQINYIRLYSPGPVVKLDTVATAVGESKDGRTVHIVADRQSLQALNEGTPRWTLGEYLGTTTSSKPDVQVDAVGWGSADYKVLQMTSGSRVWDYPRAHS